MPLSEYNREQIDTLMKVRDFLKDQSPSEISLIKDMARSFLEFRAVVADFQKENLSDICTVKCFQDMQSACCNREGIATFFADFVVNVINADETELDIMEEQLLGESTGNKCVYLTDCGCLWRYKPIVCEMFLCNHAKKALKEKGTAYISKWDRLREEERKYTWPDKPVLFDELENLFLVKGIESPLMYFHKSPGLLRLKSGWKQGKPIN